MVVKLPPNDFRKLIKILTPLRALDTADKRRQMLQVAGLEALIPRIDYHSGIAFAAITEIVTYLAQYGRISYDQEALGLFLNNLLELTLIAGEDDETFIRNLILEHQMMIPVSSAPVKIKSTPALNLTPEKIIGENTLRPVAFLAQGIHASKAVCYIVVAKPQGSYVGTGFLIAPNIVITNHHVLPDDAAAQRAIFRFNFEETFVGEAVDVTEYRRKPNGVYHSNNALDYAVVELTDNVSPEWGYLPLSKANVLPEVNQRVNIIQHPGGRPKHVSIQNNFVAYVDKTYLQYITATLPGSSGSPVLNDGWQVVALHHAGGNIEEPSTQRTYFRNQGIRVSAILADLPSNILHMIS